MTTQYKVKKVNAIIGGYCLTIIDNDGNGYRVTVSGHDVRGGNDSVRQFASQWVQNWEASETDVEEI